MNYPVWWTPWAGGGLLIAVIAVVHVFVAHFAVGGGLFLPLLERKALHKNSAPMLAFVKSYTKFFLLLTMVFGGVTGVGIWFVISLVGPAATASLIHIFVWGWAAEWVYFLVEIAALLVYYYSFSRMPAAEHLKVGWVYAIFAWLSLFVINGVIGFMLTPGEWASTGNFWDGFLNPSFWPSLVFRSCLSYVIAGLFGLMSATRVQDAETRRALTRFAVRFVTWPFVVLVLSLIWYFYALPEPQQLMIAQKSTELPPLLKGLFICTPALFLGGLLVMFATPSQGGPRRVWLAYLLIGLGLAHMGFFEWTREAARRPWLLHGIMYSTSLSPADLRKANEQGFLKTSRWSAHKEITPQNRLEVGREIYAAQCLPCHSIGGPQLDIRPRVAHLTARGLESQLEGQGRLLEYMPPFAGNAQERAALAAFLTKDRPKNEAAVKPAPAPAPEIPAFDPDKDEYALLAWTSATFMRGISDCDAAFSLAPPFVEINAQLVKRGAMPELLTKDVKITYAVPKGFEAPDQQVRFWEQSAALYGKALAPNRGPLGNGTSGELAFKSELGAFIASGVPLLPYDASGGFNALPMLTLEARDANTNQLLASTRVPAAVSTEMGCANCHAGGFSREPLKVGMSQKAGLDILRAHDRISKTTLAAQAEAGKPQRCQSCHADQAQPPAGGEKILNLSTALHGWHANYLSNRGAEACGLCHPVNPQGASHLFRSTHLSRGLDCTRCHGTLEDHALGLLKAEHAAGKPRAAGLMKNLKTRLAPSLQTLAPRQPWLSKPDCNACHDLASKPTPKRLGVNAWTKKLYHTRRDDMNAVACPACHNVAHAEYPAAAGNEQPLQYQRNPRPLGADGNCKACHTEEMSDFSHHPLPTK